MAWHGKWQMANVRSVDKWQMKMEMEMEMEMNWIESMEMEMEMNWIESIEMEMNWMYDMGWMEPGVLELPHSTMMHWGATGIASIEIGQMALNCINRHEAAACINWMHWFN